VGHSRRTCTVIVIGDNEIIIIIQVEIAAGCSDDLGGGVCSEIGGNSHRAREFNVPCVFKDLQVTGKSIIIRYKNFSGYLEVVVGPGPDYEFTPPIFWHCSAERCESIEGVGIRRHVSTGSAGA